MQCEYSPLEYYKSVDSCPYEWGIEVEHQPHPACPLVKRIVQCESSNPPAWCENDPDYNYYIEYKNNNNPICRPDITFCADIIGYDTELDSAGLPADILDGMDPVPTCERVKSYCQDPTYGELVRGKCPESCGLCSGADTDFDWGITI